ncbi:patatin-like phospholipase family protein [Thalassotalea sp. M1531]|uniref:Patatin-like phospholipase family protein n=1 Tax=Thalassotalea algicola TaxID=2716224 RepID=A0A7Y0Q644_9GAMM|nr:patatin-like phospholipase family protein [Thalassotalea algicola]NMP31609.1 patatin-like phospholipase family protein [Thalassotalea algicola]
MIEIYAGNTALTTIKEQGFSQELFNAFLGASGGPKWFTLFGLDKYLFGEFFQGRTNELNIIGSSAGAFRAACFGQADPVAAISRLADLYSHTEYSSNKPTPAEITESGRILLSNVLTKHGTNEIINNPIRKAHLVVAKCNGLVASENVLLQGSGLVSSFIRNKIDRKLIRSQYERFIFQPQSSNLAISDPDDFKTTTCYLLESNLEKALLASGSIPMVMQGIKDIGSCPKGMYRDGGIIDYHFDLKIHNPGLTLYPHFSHTLKAGWFDKNLNRNVRAENYDNTVVICPSAQFVKSLPYQKIPDRTDFSEIESKERIKNWQNVLTQSSQLADSLHEFIEQQNLDNIKPMKALIGN